MLLTALFFGALAFIAFGLKSPWDPRRAAGVAISGLLGGGILAYFNLYPGSLRVVLALTAFALFIGTVVLATPTRILRPLLPRTPVVAAAFITVLLLAGGGMFRFTSWGADTVDEPLYRDLQTNVKEDAAPALTDPRDVRVLPWGVASQLLARGYGADASWLDTSTAQLLRNTYPDTVRGEFVWVNAPQPQTSKWLVGGRVADKVIYVKNDAANLTPIVVEGTLAVNRDGAYWQDRVARFAQNEGALRTILTDVALQLDDDTRPHWIAYLASVDLRGQQHLKKLLVVDAWTGEERIYAPHEAPAWLEQVYPERYVYDWVAYWGQHREGILYRLFDAKGLVVPDDVTVRYIRLENTTYWLLPMRQLQSPQLGGYVLIDTRTGEGTFYDRFDDALVDYDTAVAQLNAIMASGEATRGQGQIRLSVAEGYLYPVKMADDSVRDAYVFPLLEGLKVSRFAIIDAKDYTTRRVFASTFADALSAFANGTTAAPGTNATSTIRMRVDDGSVQPDRIVVSLNGTLWRVTRDDLALGERRESEREFDELDLAVARANRAETVDIDVRISGGRIVDVIYRDVTWGS